MATFCCLQDNFNCSWPDNILCIQGDQICTLFLEEFSCCPPVVVAVAVVATAAGVVLVIVLLLLHSGGTLVTVYGSYLNSVAQTFINLTTVVTRSSIALSQVMTPIICKIIQKSKIKDWQGTQSNRMCHCRPSLNHTQQLFELHINDYKCCYEMCFEHWCVLEDMASFLGCFENKAQ